MPVWRSSKREVDTAGIRVAVCQLNTPVGVIAWVDAAGPGPVAGDDAAAGAERYGGSERVAGEEGEGGEDCGGGLHGGCGFGGSGLVVCEMCWFWPEG